MFMGEKFGRDSIWENHLAAELFETDVDLDVVLDEQIMRLGDILALVPGQRIKLNASPGDPVLVRCGEVPMFRGDVGRKGNYLAVRIGDPVKKQDDS